MASAALLPSSTPFGSVTVVTKVNIDDGSTRWAQGGIAAVVDQRDTPEAHAKDTLVALVGLGNPAAVDVLVREGPRSEETRLNSSHVASSYAVFCLKQK